MNFDRRTVLAGMGATAGLQALGRPALAQRMSMRWTAADIGSSGYTEASAIANALVNETGARIRVLPSGTSVGRMQQLQQGRVDMGFMAPLWRTSSTT